MHKVNKAIIMAAGEGKRMRPLTLKTPKPLIYVNGKRMIETVIEALHKNGIKEVYVIVGYLAEQFEYLEKEYQNLKLIYNPYYKNTNNISSLYVARDLICDAIILDGDQIIYNSEILESDFEYSGYNVVWNDGKTEEWILEVEDSIITGCSRTGGENGWQLFSISRWTKEDGIKLKRHLEVEFEKKNNHQIYWDDIALFCYPDKYKLGIKKMHQGDVVEIDSFQELIDIDKNYKNAEGLING